MTQKLLNAGKNGEFCYDYKYDILLFKIKNREYFKSFDFDGVVIDMDKEGFLTGVQIFDAAKMFKVPKSALRDIKEWDFRAQIEGKVITVQLSFKAMLRNKEITRISENIQRETSSPIGDSQSVCALATT